MYPLPYCRIRSAADLCVIDSAEATFTRQTGHDPAQPLSAGTGLVSGGREPPPPALAEPYVTVSRHTAPTDRRRVIETSCQWANSVGCRCFTTANA